MFIGWTWKFVLKMSQAEEFVLVGENPEKMADAASEAVNSLVKGLMLELQSSRKLVELERQISKLSLENRKLREKLERVAQLNYEASEILSDEGAGNFQQNVGAAVAVSQCVLSAALLLCLVK